VLSFLLCVARSQQGAAGIAIPRAPIAGVWHVPSAPRTLCTCRHADVTQRQMRGSPNPPSLSPNVDAQNNWTPQKQPSTRYYRSPACVAEIVTLADLCHRSYMSVTTRARGSHRSYTTADRYSETEMLLTVSRGAAQSATRASAYFTTAHSC